MTAMQSKTGNDTLARLAAVIESRRGGDPDKSYVARLFRKGTDAILKKIGEEATEVVMACKDGDADKIVGEVADLWFHSMLALGALRPRRRPMCWPSWSGARGCPGWKSLPPARRRPARRTGKERNMNDVINDTSQVIDPQRESSLRTIGHISYVLHAVVAVSAVLPGVQASIVLLIVAFILDLVKRDDAAGTWQESHFRWRIRTVLWAGGLYVVTIPLWSCCSCCRAGSPGA